jgi:hypothetical protein
MFDGFIGLPSGPIILTPSSRSIRPLLDSLWLARLCSARNNSATFISKSPNGPGTSIGLTISPPRSLLCSARYSSDALLSDTIRTASSPRSPSGPLVSICKLFGRNMPVFFRSTLTLILFLEVHNRLFRYHQLSKWRTTALARLGRAYARGPTCD